MAIKEHSSIDITNSRARLVQTAVIVLAVMALLLTGCSALLPTVREQTPAKWQSYDEAKSAFDSIEPYKTDMEGLKELGIDPFTSPNITILTYLDISKSVGTRPLDELDKGIQDCIRAGAMCQAYEYAPDNIRRKRHGNFWLDLFNFRRQTKITGWRFKALIIVVEDQVVYKLWGGNPIINEERDEKNPLGPLQDAGGSYIGRKI